MKITLAAPIETSNLLHTMPKIDLTPKNAGELWLRAEPGEEDLNVVIARLLGLSGNAAPRSRSVTSAVKGDFVDPKYHVRFPEGFSIYRNYKGQTHIAKVVNGLWEMDDFDARLNSLNALNRKLGIETENAWVSWSFDDPDTGERRLIATLRDPEMVAKRQKETAASKGRR